MIPWILITLLFSLMPGQKEPETKPPAFKWLAASGETSGIRLGTHNLELISVPQQAPASEDPGGHAWHLPLRAGL